MYALTNCDIFSGTSIIHDKAVVVDGSRIMGLLDVSEAKDLGAEILDLGGFSVAPGFIDLQVNGGGGILFNDNPSKNAVNAIVRAHRRFGTTDLLPTFITGPETEMNKAIGVVVDCLMEDMPGVLGIHLEGPFINKEKKGVHDPEYIRLMQGDDLKNLTELTRYGVALITLAPELVQPSNVRQLVDHGAFVAAGHTDATSNELTSAVAEGLKGITHLFNAMSPMQGREPGVVGAALADDRVWCSIIVDGFHVDFTSLLVAWKAKPRGKLLLATDAMPTVGTDGAPFVLGNYEIRVENGRCVTGDGVLAGSALDMATAVRNCVQQAGIPKDEALRMASTYPAHAVGVHKSLGLIDKGYMANLVVLDNELYVRGICIHGEFEMF